MSIPKKENKTQNTINLRLLCATWVRKWNYKSLYKRGRYICIELITLLLLLYFVFIETNQFIVNTIVTGIFKGTAIDCEHCVYVQNKTLL